MALKHIDPKNWPREAGRSIGREQMVRMGWLNRALVDTMKPIYDDDEGMAQFFAGLLEIFPTEVWGAMASVIPAQISPRSAERIHGIFERVQELIGPFGGPFGATAAVAAEDPASPVLAAVGSSPVIDAARALVQCEHRIGGVPLAQGLGPIPRGTVCPSCGAEWIGEAVIGDAGWQHVPLVKLLARAMDAVRHAR